jgi:uncharacterized protein (TIGR02145 family)
LTRLLELQKRKNYLSDTRDGQLYRTITIGDQNWMAENLNYKADSGSWCYNNNDSNCTLYGRLYDWEIATIVCPKDWHLPTDDDWSDLSKSVAIADNDVDGTKLKATSLWNGKGSGNDDFGFTALPGGARNPDSTYFGLGNYGNWWSLPEKKTNFSWARTLIYNQTDLIRWDRDLKGSFSVRCVKDFRENNKKKGR